MYDNQYLQLLKNQEYWIEHYKTSNEKLEHFKDDFVGAYYDNFDDTSVNYPPPIELQELIKEIIDFNPSKNKNIDDFVTHIRDEISSILKKYCSNNL